MLRRLFGAVFAVAVAASPAQAQWKYEFSGLFNDNTVPLKYEFVLFTAAPVVGPGQVSPSTCSVTRLDAIVSPYYQCEPPGPGMAQNGFGTGISLIDAKFQSFDVGNPNAIGGGGAFFWFAPSAFFTPGTYSTFSGVIAAPKPGFDPDDCLDFSNPDACNFYGSAGAATLIVSNTTPTNNSVVPEPSTYVLMASGLLGLGVMARRRRELRG